MLTQDVIEYCLLAADDCIDCLDSEFNYIKIIESTMSQSIVYDVMQAYANIEHKLNNPLLIGNACLDVIATYRSPIFFG